MKKHKLVLLYLHVLGLATIAALMALLPDQIPMHYNIAGEADRIGSKYEMLIFSLIALSTTVILLLAGRKKNEKLFYLTASALTVMLYGMGIAYSIHALREGGSMDVYRLTGVLTGVPIIILGNAMPKAKRNALFGLRTEWSMYNDEVWRKSQRYGGIAMMMAGFAMLLGAVLFGGWINFVIISAAVLAATVAGVRASKRYYDEAKTKE